MIGLLFKLAIFEGADAIVKTIITVGIAVAIAAFFIFLIVSGIYLLLSIAGSLVGISVALAGPVAVAVTATGAYSYGGKWAVIPTAVAAMVGVGMMLLILVEVTAEPGILVVAAVVSGATVLVGFIMSMIALPENDKQVWIQTIALAGDDQQVWKRKLLAITRDDKYAGIRKFIIYFGSQNVTSFGNADLTDANFSHAKLKGIDFTKAIVTRTFWRHAENLDWALVDDTMLEDIKVRQLVVTGDGQDKNFDRFNLRGINLQEANLADASFMGADLSEANLQGANLADASFMGTDLSEANLQDADLSRTLLVQTQLDQTDLTGATLTGAIIEDWGITGSTKLHGVRCEYIFMRVPPTPDDPNPRRKPDNWEEKFADGDFEDFITPIIKTLDLYHNQDVDSRAIALAYRNLAENHPEAALGIVAMEVRGKNKDKFLLRVETSEEANHSEMNAEYFRDYNQIKSLPRESLLLLLAERDNQINRL